MQDDEGVELDYLNLVQTVISASDFSGDVDAQAMSLLAKTPAIIAATYRMQHGQEPVKADSLLSHVASYLYMLTGVQPDPRQVEALQRYFILAAEHSLNASTFTARVSTSAHTTVEMNRASNIKYSIVAAMSTLHGFRHGGALLEVAQLFKEAQARGLASCEDWIVTKIKNKELIPGFGHREYVEVDPRARFLRDFLAENFPEYPLVQFALKFEPMVTESLRTHKPSCKNPNPNLECWAAVLLQVVGIPEELFIPTFAAARLAGWIAHILEQMRENCLIRPQAAYAGPEPTLQACETKSNDSGLGSGQCVFSFPSPPPEKNAGIQGFAPSASGVAETAESRLTLLAKSQ